MATRIIITSDSIGRGDDELGRVLVRNFVYSLARHHAKPLSITFMNAGVKLMCEGSEVHDDLRLLAEDGVAVKACGTCLDYLRLTDKLAVGEVGTMPDSVAAVMAGDEVVTLG
jgi:selenium metabolism protein YedF